MSPAQEHHTQAIFPNGDAAIALQPGVRAFDFPAMSSPTQLPAVLRGWLHSIAAMRADQLHPLCGQPLTSPGRDVPGLGSTGLPGDVTDSETGEVLGNLLE